MPVLTGDHAAMLEALGEQWIIGGEAVYGTVDRASAIAVGARTRRAGLMVEQSVSDGLALGDLVYRRSTGEPFAVRGIAPDGTGLAMLTLELQADPTGEGVAFRFDSHFLRGAEGHKQNDHAVIKIGDTFHKFTIYGTDYTATGSAYFTHYTSPDLRSWTQLANVEIGTGVTDNWRCEVWAPCVILNPNYAVQGASLATYKYLMFFAACSGSGLLNTYQKIGLAGCTSDTLLTWVILNDDAPIYWSGLATTGYPAGAPWCPTATYDAAWCHASRDPFVWTDGADWWLLITAKSVTNTNRNCIGLAKFAGGTSPDWLDIEHEAAALCISTGDGNWQLESSQMHYINGLWHLFTKGQYGTRHQGLAAMKGAWSGSAAAGQAVTYGLGMPSTYEAGELIHLDGLRYTLSGHATCSDSDGSEYYYYGYVDLDFTGCDTAGEHPTRTAMYRVPSLLGTTGGVMDLDLTWTQIDDQGIATSFYAQPCFGDGPGDAGDEPSGMTGSAYLNTRFNVASPYDEPGTKHSTARKGAIQSADFTLTRDRMSLTVAGTYLPARCFVALVNAADDRVLFLESGVRLVGDAMVEVLEARCWDLTTLKGLTVYLVAAAMGDDVEDHIAADVIREYQASEEDDPATASTPFAIGAGPAIAYLLKQGGVA